MPTQGDFWVLVLVGLLIANLVFRFYVRLDLDKKINELLQEVKSVKENLLNDKNLGEFLREVKGVKESVLYVKQDFDKRIIELLQEVNDIKGRLILDLDKKMDRLSQEVESIREGIEQLEQQTKERIERIAKLLTEPIFDEDQLKI
jgi:methyl-accepting chemotaxis protein